MIVILGLILLVAATIVGLAGVLGNAGSGHALTGGFSVFGYDVTGSTGTLLFYGIVVGAVPRAPNSNSLAARPQQSARTATISSISARPITSTRRRKLDSPLRPTATANPARAPFPLPPGPHLGSPFMRCSTPRAEHPVLPRCALLRSVRARPWDLEAVSRPLREDRVFMGGVTLAGARVRARLIGDLGVAGE